MADLNEGVSLQKAAQVRLDNLGQIKSRSTFINDPTRLERLRARFELQRSLGRREELERLDDEDKMEGEMARLAEKLPGAVQLFNANQTGKRAFTKECAMAMLLIIFRKSPAKSAKKADLIKLLGTESEHQPELMVEAIAKYCGNPDNRTEPAFHSQLADWLFLKCREAAPTMETELSALELSLYTLKVIEGIGEGDEDDDQIAARSQIKLFTAMGKVGKKRNSDFIMDVSGKVEEILGDNGVNEEALKECDKKIIEAV